MMLEIDSVVLSLSVGSFSSLLCVICKAVLTGILLNSATMSNDILDIYILSDDKGTIITKVYRKATHTDLYLNWHSHHPVSARMAVVRTLFHRAQTVCSNKELLEEEHQHLKTVLKLNDYPDWAIHKGSKIKQQNNDGQATVKEKKDFKGFIVIPYVKGLSEPYKRVMEKIGIQVFFKGGTTLKNMLVAPKDKDPKGKTQNIV